MEKIKKTRIKKINIVKNEDVYDLTIKDNHNFFANNILVHNCGEVPLSPYDSCRLGSLNLSNIVLNEYTLDAKINWEFVEYISKFAQRVMDDIIDLEEEKINAIIFKIKNDPEEFYIKETELRTWERVLNVLKKGRRTGIGVLGLGDMFAKLGIKYGANESLTIVNKLFSTMAINVYKESVTLAKERGSFEVWDLNKEKNNPFIHRVIYDNFNSNEIKDYETYGRRNIASLSIAPTGSLAIEALATSGIEPVFKIRSLRRKKINPNDPDAKIDFIDDSGDAWEEYSVFHNEFINWFIYKNKNEYNFKDAKILLSKMSEKELDEIINESPWANSESHQIDYMGKVKMQGIIQKWIDHSISVTHNLPENITEDKVNDIYFAAWKYGCKGCTIYRDGSRSGVLLADKKEEPKENVFNETRAPKRPKTLKADYYIAKNKGREFAVIIGLLENKPYEIFAFENPPVSKNTKGVIVKVRKGIYKFINGEFEIENIQLAADRIEERTLTLSASMLLRHGAPIENVVKVIKKIDENITSFSSVVRRYLSKYTKDEEVEGVCPMCGGELVREEGCVHCSSCSFSLC